MRNRLRQLGQLLHAQRVRAHLAITRFAQSHVKECSCARSMASSGRKPGKFRHITYKADASHVGQEGIVFRHIADQ